MVRILRKRTASAASSSAPSAPVRRGRRSGQKYWEEQGWQLRGNDLVGYYRTHYGSFKGLIELFDSGDHMYYVYDPPHQLKQHARGHCFAHRGEGKYWVHFALKPRNVDAGIITIEKILRETLEQF